ncbi:hypothetical protein AVEN_185515-1 [Araneus ventricosus]|uniref:Uncharacterized protein n=1 Tax=Araneus ventricosus TaxID=182803 RepID=A0A4Y2ND78_ARAVE|nr:hypothetical protein AVEN_185515-1 [Araneus ventricosus]
MLSDGVIRLHNNTHTARKIQELLQKFKWKFWSHLPTVQIRHPIWFPNTYLEQRSLQGVLDDSSSVGGSECVKPTKQVISLDLTWAVRRVLRCPPKTQFVLVNPRLYRPGIVMMEQIPQNPIDLGIFFECILSFALQ